MSAGLDTLIVDKDMGLFDLADMFWAMKGVTGGDGKSMNMPISGNASPAPQPTAKPYRVDYRRAVPIRCCRGPSNRGTRPKLPDFVRR